MILLKQALHDNGMVLDQQQITKLDAYLHELTCWNKTYNLTAITERKEQVYKHLMDSLSICDAVLGPSVCDVGSGPGLPGIPLAIALPNVSFTLVDSSQKRVVFMRHVLIKLGIDNVTVLHQRIEDVTPPMGGFNTVVSRAFSSLHSFIDKTQHLLAADGQFLSMKGLYPSEELEQIKQDFVLIDVRKLTIVGLDALRHLIIIKKQVMVGGKDSCNC
jgi:16S rRNA (guanine527-N7)-methyltransferase